MFVFEIKYKIYKYQTLCLVLKGSAITNALDCGQWAVYLFTPLCECGGVARGDCSFKYH